MFDVSKVVFGETKVKWTNRENLPELQNDVREGKIGTIIGLFNDNENLFKVEYEVDGRKLIYGCKNTNLDFAEPEPENKQTQQSLPSVVISHKNVKILQIIIDKCPEAAGFKIEKTGF